MVGADFFGADGFALELVGAVAEAFCVHLSDHAEDALVFLGLSLWEVVEMGGFRGDEEHGGGVFTRGDAGSAADAGGGVKGGVGVWFWNLNSVGIGRGAGADADVSARADDAVEGGSVGDEVFDDGEGVGAEGLDPDGFAIGEFAHVKLASGDAAFFGMRDAIDGHGAHAADAFATIVVEVDGVFTVFNEALVDDVDHLEEGSRSRDFLGLVCFDTAF